MMLRKAAPIFSAFRSEFASKLKIRAILTRSGRNDEKDGHFVLIAFEHCTADGIYFWTGAGHAPAENFCDRPEQADPSQKCSRRHQTDLCGPADRHYQGFSAGIEYADRFYGSQLEVLCSGHWIQ